MPRKDRTKQNEYQRAWYSRNKEKVKAQVAVNKAKYRQRWRDYKATLKCAYCGFDHPAALDFHHVKKSPDNRTINQLLRQDAYRAIMEEIKKCIVLCSNCHRLHHHDEREQAKSEQP